MTDERHLTVEQVAERLQVSAWTVRDWLRTGRLHGYKVGGRAGWRVRESELQRLVETMERDSRLAEP